MNTKASNIGKISRNVYENMCKPTQNMSDWHMVLFSVTLAPMERIRGAQFSLVQTRRRWEDNIKMDLREIWFGDVDRINLAQDRDRWRALVNTVMNLRVP
jgi:hypothetical protein